MKLPEDKTEIVNFECNICAQRNSTPFREFTREGAFCTTCNSTPRLRSVVYVLSTELFGEDLSIVDFFVRKKIFRGIGMSDSPQLAETLVKSLEYTNTYFDKKPRLDITGNDYMNYLNLDFIISSEVLEHVAPPVLRAFDNIAKMLNKGGLLCLSVPFPEDRKDTVEHFPHLCKYKVYEFFDKKILVNETIDGLYQVSDGLIFHSDGAALELRLFSLPDLISHLKSAGFNDIKVHNEGVLERGIYWPLNVSHIISARKG